MTGLHFLPSAASQRRFMLHHILGHTGRGGVAKESPHLRPRQLLSFPMTIAGLGQVLPLGDQSEPNRQEARGGLQNAMMISRKFQGVYGGSRCITVSVFAKQWDLFHCTALRSQVVGVDYEEAYVTKAQDMVQSAGLKDRVVVFCLSIYDDIVPSLVKRQLTQVPLTSSS